MWPWGHLAVGYVVFSLGLRVIGEDRPGAWATLLLVFATQLPDLIDKPLSWSFEVFPTGYGAAHSLFFAVPAITAVAIATGYTDNHQYGVAFGVGYATHLLTDVVYAAVIGSAVTVGRVIWPLGAPNPYAVDRSFLGRFMSYFSEFIAEILRGDATGLLLLYLVLFALVIGLWTADGFPIARECTQWLRAQFNMGGREP